MIPRARLAAAAVLVVSAAYPGAAAAQEWSHLVVASEARDTIAQAVRSEFEQAGFKYMRADKKSVEFERDAGNVNRMGESAPVTLKTTVRMEDGKPGTRLVVLEEMVATYRNGFEERRTPNPRDRAGAYLNLLNHVKQRVEQGQADRAESILMEP
jgi:hypothetical protein